MFQYPFSKKKENNQIINKTRLGKTLEQNIDLTNDFYREKNIAMIFKNEIPIKIVKVKYLIRQQAKITEAYYNKKSLPDYQGIYKGRYLCFDTKETNNLNNFPLSNVPSHQIDILDKIKKFNGISFFIINFKKKNKYFYMPIEFLINYLKTNTKKSINYEIFQKELYEINFSYYPKLDYIKIVNHFI
ncbi:recombination protein U [Candidatus Phytoplasma luffae]|uniref:Holliday junction resolvase RecU n=1 Tax=Loofah witches'-broom phytoplasma TaxID=35773 RepID=A0A975IM86_LOWBP|nr:Holliday junction resolvase RecU [Candidatus Phytoplasma luffae]QTX03247.1 recombination protein U [Candidatus Phytoplasma luffae]